MNQAWLETADFERVKVLKASGIIGTLSASVNGR